MDPISRAAARARAYDLWAALVLDGLTPEALAAARVLPVLAEVLPEGDADRRAADHLRSLGFDVLPWESVFLSDTGLLAGPLASEVAGFYAGAGFQPYRSDAEPDHLGVELYALGHLSALEAQALAAGEDPEPLREQARLLLDEHLLRWLPTLVLAVRAQGDRFWSTVVETALELAAAHRSEVQGDMSPFTLPDPPPLLDDPRTGLRRVADVWLRPAWSGLFLGRHDIEALAAAAAVPRGFGSRLQQLESVLFAAADHQRMPALLSALDERLVAAQQGYRALGALGVDVSAWIGRLDRTRADVARMRSASA